LGEIAGERLTPVIVARNVSKAPTTLVERIPYTKADGSTNVILLPDLRLAPGEIRMVDTKSALRRSNVESDVAAGLEFEYTGELGSVVLLAQSVTKNGDQAFVVPMWDILGQRSATGGYPWKVEGDSSTMVYLKNVTEHTQQYVMEIGFAGGQYGYTAGIKTIQAGQSIAVDIRKLRDEQVPDANGRTIPLNASRGQIHWSARSVDSLPIIGRSEQVDLVNGISSSYACQNCCPDSYGSAGMSPGFAEIPIAERFGFTAMETGAGCYLRRYTPYPVSGASWSSSDTLVAQMVGDGLVEGMNEGSADITAEWPGIEVIQDGGTTCMAYETTNYAGGSAAVVPRPRITGLSLRIIDFAPNSTEVRECGTFEIKVRFTAITGNYIVQLTGNIEEDVTTLDANDRVISTNSDGTTNYETTFLLRMKNRLDNNATTGQTSYVARVVSGDRVATRRCVDGDTCVSVRNTIPGTGACQ